MNAEGYKNNYRTQKEEKMNAKLKFNLQFFAEEVEETATTETADNTQQTFTRDEVLKLIQAESDKRVTQALATAQKKFDKQLSLSKLDDNARAAAEKDDKIAELEQQLAAFQVERNKSELKSVLASRGLSAEFADIITINDDIEQSQANIDKLDKLFKDAVKNEVEKRLAGNAPKKGTGATAEITKEAFSKMPLSQQVKIYQENPELYKKLTE